MPPQTRSSRTHTKRELEEHAKALCAGPVNLCGLPALPAETLLEIASWYPIARIPAMNPSLQNPRYIDRQQALRSLSQTCHRLRSIFMETSWYRLEVCSSSSVNRSHLAPSKRDRWPREMATELVEKMETVMVRAPYLAGYVRYASSSSWP
jgi:hypothetical protein